MEKLTERLDLRGIRVVRHTRVKLDVVQSLSPGRLKQAQILREAIERGLDQLFTELGKEAIEMLCRQMSASSGEQRGAGPMSVNVGDRRQTSGKREEIEGAA